MWRIESNTARYQPQKVSLGSKLSLEQYYQRETGSIARVIGKLVEKDLTYIDDYFYWDSEGNLVLHADATTYDHQVFYYDELNRLIKTDTASYESIEGSVSTLTAKYDELGNIFGKSDVGRYVYNETGVPSQCGEHNHPPGPHAVRRTVGFYGNYYCYDAAGNMVKNFRQTLKYTPFNKPYSIQYNLFSSKSVDIEYGPDRNRYKRIDSGSSGKSTTYYLGDFERVIKSGEVKDTITIAGFGQIITKSSTKNPIINYFFKDHQGTILKVINEHGRLQAPLDYNNWGHRLQSLFPEITDYSNPFTNRGYTGHEHLDPVNLIHMNGRVYDPRIGRFVSPDPIIQDISNLQNLNRYSYVLNNPKSYTDPSGYNWVSERWKDIKEDSTYVINTVGGWSIDVYNSVTQAVPILRYANKKISNSPDLYKIGQVAAGVADIAGCGGYCSAAYAAHFTAASGGTAIQVGLAGLSGYGTGSLAIGGANAWGDGIVQWAAGQYANMKTRDEIARYAEKNHGLTLTEFNLALLGISFAGNFVAGTRVTDNFKEFDIQGINGMLTRGENLFGFAPKTFWNRVIGAPFDLVDAVIAYQGIPTASAIEFVLAYGKSAHIWAHSLGTLDANNLMSLGWADKAVLFSLPFGNIASPGVVGFNAMYDPISGFDFGIFFNPYFNYSNCMGHSIECITGFQ